MTRAEQPPAFNVSFPQSLYLSPVGRMSKSASVYESGGFCIIPDVDAQIVVLMGSTEIASFGSLGHGSSSSHRLVVSSSRRLIVPRSSFLVLPR